jgi:hypothetical protein
LRSSTGGAFQVAPRPQPEFRECIRDLFRDVFLDGLHRDVHG